jgi:hypothetical protein
VIEVIELYASFPLDKRVSRIQRALMLLLGQLLYCLQTIGRSVGFLGKQLNHALKQHEVPSFARKPRWVSLEEQDDLFSQIQPIVHLEPITKSVIGAAVTLHVNPTATEEISKVVEDGSIGRFQLEAEAGFDFGPTTTRSVQVDGEAAFSINQPDHVVGRQHPVSPFRRVASHSSYYGSADFPPCFQSSFHGGISRGH